MIQQCHISLDGLSAMLNLIEKGREVRYRLTLAPDRSACALIREVIDGYTVIEHLEERALTRAQVCDDASRHPTLIWLARGMWGIPLEYEG